MGFFGNPQKKAEHDWNNNLIPKSDFATDTANKAYQAEINRLRQQDQQRRQDDQRRAEEQRRRK